MSTMEDQPREEFSSPDKSMNEPTDDHASQSFDLPTAQDDRSLETEGFQVSPKLGDESFETQEVQVPTKKAAPPLKSCFKRRNSMTAETSMDRAPSANGTPKAERESPEIVDPFALNVRARLCGPSRSRCGYCGGKRLHVLGVDDGHNKVLDLRKRADQKPSILFNGDSDSETVDEENTSKSYGLLFDYLPYDTYQELIDRGWRRSGKHLYRPHNFESCCPAISIRLDTAKFAPCTSKTSQSELERSILVGGSKSQKRVGRNLLRALKAYNDEYDRSTKSKHETDEQLHVAKMKLAPDSEKEAASSDRVIDNATMQAEVTADSHRKVKRSRRASPRNDDPVETAINRAESNACSLPNKQVLNMIQESEQYFLQKLAQVTYQIITDKVAKMAGDNSRPKWAWWAQDPTSQSNNIAKWCSYKIAPVDEKRQKEDGVSSSITVMASTVACAAASGRSRGLIDKSELAATVVELLKGYLSESHNNQTKLVYDFVECHEKSGQIHIIFRLPQNYVADLSLSQSSPTQTKSGTPKASSGEPFARFLSKFYRDEQSAKPATFQSETARNHLHLVVRTVPVFESSLQPEVHRLFCTYQTATHGDSNPFSCNETNKNHGETDGEYSFHLRQKYKGFLDIDAAYSHLSAHQRSKIKKSYLSFYRFLCETPLKHEALDSSCTGKGADHILDDGYDTNISRGGTYHQQYRLCTSKDSFDGPLLAVGVVDILPSCLSSVYAFYDPTLSASLELGKYTALREIEWVRRSKCITNRNYYLGYYIHSCQKMIYKAEYKPSQLLCPVHFRWIDFEAAKKRLEQRSPTRHNCDLCDDEPAADSADKSVDIENIVLDIGDGGFMGGSSFVTLSMLSIEGRRLIDPVITEYVNKVGMVLARKLIVKLS